MPALDVLLLGPLQVRFDGHDITPGSKKLQALIGVLAAAGRPQRRGHLAALLWTRGGLRNLRQALYSLRQLPGAEHWLRLDGSEWVALEGRSDLADLTEAMKLGRFDQARALLRGPVLDGLVGEVCPVFDDWLGELEGELDLLTAPLEELRDEAPLRLAQVLALSTTPPDQPTLSALLGLSAAEVLAATEQLERDHLLGPGGLTPRAAARVRAQTGDLTASALHRRFGELLWQDDPAAAAHHLEAAGDLDRAAEAWRDAGDLQAALRCAREPRLRATLLASALDEAETGGQAARSEELLADLASLARRCGLPDVVGEAALRGATAALRGGRHDEALDLAEEADQVALAHGLQSLRARVGVLLGQTLIFAGRLAEAAVAFERGAAGSDDDPTTELRARAGLGAVAGMRGDGAAGAEHHRAALVLAQGLGDRRLVARLSLNLGCDLERLGRDRAAAARFIDARLHAAEIGDLSVQFVATVNLATCLLHLGELAAAVRALEAAAALPAGIWPGDRGLVAAGWAELDRAVGRFAASAASHAEAAAHFEGVGDQRRALLAHANAAVARYAAGTGELEQALGLLRGPLIQPAGDGIGLELALACVTRGQDPAPALAVLSGEPGPPRFGALRGVIEALWRGPVEGDAAEALVRAVESSGELAPLVYWMAGDDAAATRAATQITAELEPQRRTAYEGRLAGLRALVRG